MIGLSVNLKLSARLQCDIMEEEWGVGGLLHSIYSVREYKTTTELFSLK